MNRRSFITGMVPGLAGSAAVLRHPRGVSERLAELGEDVDRIGDGPDLWRRVRAEFVLHPGLAHLNAATLGSTPGLVLDAIHAWNRQIEGNPAVQVFGALGQQMEEVRGRASSFLGAQPDEVLLTRNTTEGMNLVATGWALSEGDEILTTNHEHPGGRVGWDFVAQTTGARVVEIPMPAPVSDEGEVLRLVEAHITPRTRVCSFSHVCTVTGLRMPMAAIARLTRLRGIALVCDGAQAPGMLNVDVAELGVDTYASSSHKWMLAAKGSGLLYIRKGLQDSIRHVFLQHGSKPYTASTGTRNVAHVLGHGTAMAFHETLGRKRVENRCLELAGFLRERLGRLPYMQLLSPPEGPLSSAITSYALTRGTNREVAQALSALGMVVKVIPVDGYNGLRFSTHVFNGEREIDALAHVLVELLGT